MSRSRLKWLRESDEDVAPPKPYTDAERAAMLAELERRRQNGESLKAIAADLGISESCYYNWKQRLASLAVPILRPVTVVDCLVPARSSPPVLISPAGYRVEGLTMSDLLQLLREVG